MTGNPATDDAANDKARMMVVGLTVGLACSELLAQGQSSLERARELVSIGSFDKAEAMLHQAIAADPNNVDARVLLGTTLALRENRNEAIEQLAEAVRLNPSSATAHNEFGMVLSRFVEVRAARQELERALELDPGLAEAHVNLSLVLAQAGELAAAGDHLDRAIELQGNHRKAAYAHYLRAKIWAAQDQTGKAMVEFQTAVHLRPNYAEAWSDLAARGVWSLPGRVFPCFHPHASAGKKDRHEPLGETAAATPPDSLT